MGFVTIEDMNGALEVIVFSRVYASSSDLLTEGRALLIQGQIQKDEQSVKLIADTLIPLEKAEETWTASVHVNLELSRTDREVLLSCGTCCSAFPGPARPSCTCAVRLARKP